MKTIADSYSKKDFYEFQNQKAFVLINIRFLLCKGGFMTPPCKKDRLQSVLFLISLSFLSVYIITHFFGTPGVLFSIFQELNACVCTVLFWSTHIFLLYLHSFCPEDISLSVRPCPLHPGLQSSYTPLFCA